MAVIARAIASERRGLRIRYVREEEEVRDEVRDEEGVEGRIGGGTDPMYRVTGGTYDEQEVGRW